MMSGMDSGPLLRQAVRAIVLDDAGRILLVRFEFPEGSAANRSVWATPGGGIEAHESEREALTRELTEETGVREIQVGPLVWTRTHLFPMSTGHEGQQERYYLVRTPAFEPAPELTPAELREESVAELRWWTMTELARSREVFAPRQLPRCLASLLADGPPAIPIDVGV